MSTEKNKRQAKASLTRSLTELASLLSLEQPERPGIKTMLEHIEEQKQETLGIMDELKSALEKLEKMDEAERGKTGP